jgi:hypothetical protein
MSGTVSWYLFAAVLTLVAAGVLTGVDAWLMSQPRPLRLRALVVMAGRWGFFMSILMFAWLIDSHRVEYQEAGLWILIVVGALGAGLLKLAARK